MIDWCPRLPVDVVPCARYDAGVAYADAQIQVLLEEMTALDLLRNTLTVVTSDHGTEFFEHGGKGHRSTLYDELIRKLGGDPMAAAIQPSGQRC